MQLNNNLQTNNNTNHLGFGETYIIQSFIKGRSNIRQAREAAEKFNIRITKAKIMKIDKFRRLAFWTEIKEANNTNKTKEKNNSSKFSAILRKIKEIDFWERIKKAIKKPEKKLINYEKQRIERTAHEKFDEELKKLKRLGLDIHRLSPDKTMQTGSLKLKDRQKTDAKTDEALSKIHLHY
jgi:hypothetical protein